jgi:radical SAM superfamily enzyme YgiQ (UPF0313 family)
MRKSGKTNKIIGPRLADLYRREKGDNRAKPFGEISVALVYPNSYHVGMSNLGFLWVYRAINSDPSFRCDRAFFDRKGRPLTVEKGLPLSSYDVVAFSISFETDFLNVIEILEQSGIPSSRKERNQKHPLVTAGGVGVFLNPLVMGPVMDAIFIGESEEILPGFLNTFEQKIGQNRIELLEALSIADGIFVPEVSKDVPPRKYVKKLVDPAYSVIVSPDTEFKNRTLIETGRGCVYGCKFCAAQNAFHPARFYPKENILKSARKNSEFTKNVGLVSTAVDNHPEIEQICTELRQENFRISVSSLRADMSPDIVLQTLASSGQKTFTIAPETGSDRLRRSIGKRVENHQILACIERAKKAGMRFCKLYFMIGLPGEKQSDVNAIVELVAEAKKIMPVRLSINPFVPKPCTPFEKCKMELSAILKEEIYYLRKKLNSLGGVKVKFGSVRKAALDALLSRGDAQVGQALIDHSLNDLNWGWYIYRDIADTEDVPWVWEK